MKKIITLLFVAFCLQNTFAQSYKIMSTAAGKLENFVGLTDGDELYGYVELRQLDEISQNEVKFKYIILDKNMNMINSGEFTETKVKKKCIIENYQIVYNNNHILFNFKEIFSANNVYMTVKCKYQILDLTTNKIVKKGVYDTTIDPEEDNIPKLSRNLKFYGSAALSDVGFLIQRASYDKEKKETPYFGIDFNGKEIWNQAYKPLEKKYEYEYSLFEMDENTISLLTTINKSGRKESDHLLILDSKTGKEISYTDLFNEDYTLRFSYSKINDNNLIMIGRYFEKDKRDRVGYDESLGLYKRVIDIKSGKIISDKFLPYGNFKLNDISENGKIKGEGLLGFKKIDQNPDGSFFILAETYRNKSSIDLYTELYTFLLDKDFNPMSVKSFDTEKSRGSKYSFSQDLLNNTGKVYFFYDKNDDKKLELNLINYNFATNEIKLSKMNVDTKESSITVMPAKTGYIAIREYKNNPKKGESAMEIRLEKLNYERQ
jgi:hypothetical protein